MDKKKFEKIDNYLNAADKNLARKELIAISQHINMIQIIFI